MISAVLHSEKKTPKQVSNKNFKTDQTSIEEARISSKFQQQNDINLKIEVNPLNLFLNHPESPKMSNSESQQQHPRYAQKKYSSGGRERAYLDRYGYDIWKRTPNTTPASTVLNSPDLHDMETKHISSFQHHQVVVGRSPVGFPDSPNSSDRNSPIPTNLTKDGEVVVFDDIADDWRKIQEKFNQEESVSNNSKITKMIGVLPITEYEGSPRRFGNIHYDDDEVEIGVAGSSTTVHRLPSLLASPTSSLGGKKTPGFPKRVLTKSQIDETNLLEKNSTFDYLYEFSETRKVLEEFFKCPGVNENCGYDQNCDSETGSIDHIQCNPLNENSADNSYIGERLSQLPTEEFTVKNSPRQTGYEHNEIELYFDSGSRSSGDLVDMDCMDPNMRRLSMSPGTTDYDSNCGDLDSLSNDLINGIGSEYARVYTSMPVLEDGLSSGHSSDNENNNPNPNCDFDHLASVVANKLIESPQHKSGPGIAQRAELLITTDDSIEPNRLSFINLEKSADVETALKDIRSTLQRTKIILESQEEILGIENNDSPIWVQRRNSHESLESEENPSKIGVCCDDEEADTDLETDRLLGQQRLDDQGFYDEKSWNERKSPQIFNSATIYQGNSILPNSPESAISITADDSNDNKDGSPQNKDTDEKRPTRNKEGEIFCLL